MRDDEDNIRQYLPVLRRIIILVAVLTAIPVVIWTITAFVRSHVHPPQPPTLQPMAIVPPSVANTTVATASDQAPSQAIDAAQATQLNADTKDAGGTSAPAASAYAAPTDATSVFKTASVGGPADPKADATSAPASATGGAASPADGAVSNQSPDTSPQPAGQPQDSVPPPAPTPVTDALPPGEPISGPVPLPRKRPTSFAVAGNIPLPAPRPEDAGGGSLTPTPTPIDWLKKVFHSSPAPAQPSEGASDTARE